MPFRLKRRRALAPVVPTVDPNVIIATTSAAAPPPAAPPAAVKRKKTKSKGFALPRRSVASLENAAAAAAGAVAESSVEEQCFEVLFCKRSNKKHKVYDDGFLVVGMGNFGKGACLYSTDGAVIRQMGHFGVKLEFLGGGSEFDMGTKEVEVVGKVDMEAFSSGRLFLCATSAGIAPSAAPRKPKAAAAFRRVRSGKGGGGKGGKGGLLPGRTASGAIAVAVQLKARHDPTRSDAVIIEPASSSGGGAVGKRRGGSAVAIVLDPLLASKLRPHQVEAVRGMWDCIRGRRTANETGGSGVVGGCILAHAMGLGKTLSVLALLWTALRQGPSATPLAQRAVIVTPASLVLNWKAEVLKWFGSIRLKVCTITEQGAAGAAAVACFVASSAKVAPLMIIGYEAFRRHVDTLCGGGKKGKRPRTLSGDNRATSSSGLQSLRGAILVCDEGHRLKNAKGNQTIRALNRFPSHRRIIVTGTPVQNALLEFYALIQFIRPADQPLGSIEQFQNVFARPIEKSRDRGSSPRTRRIGEERSAQLAATTKAFVFRANRSILAGKLPPRYEYVVVVRPAPVQIALYRALVSQIHNGSIAMQQPLVMIGLLRKLCNHPDLLMSSCDTAVSAALLPEEARSAALRLHADAYTVGAAKPAVSGKMLVLRSLIREARILGDKLVIVSNFTKTLDVVDRMCSAMGERTVRLDGSTDTKKRQPIVNKFNRPEKKGRTSGGRSTTAGVFLLSAKAGGVGLNLIGANRLVLIEPDWNPATDEQAMARVWRGGQTKPCFIYRLLVVGTIDEKIFQRQLSKHEVANEIGRKSSGKSSSSSSSSKSSRKKSAAGSFTPAELRELFTLRDDTVCETAEIMEKKNRSSSSGGGGGSQEESDSTGRKWSLRGFDEGAASSILEHDSVLRKSTEATAQIAFVHLHSIERSAEAEAEAKAKAQAKPVAVAAAAAAVIEAEDEMLPPAAVSTAAVFDEADTSEEEEQDHPEEQRRRWWRWRRW